MINFFCEFPRPKRRGQAVQRRYLCAKAGAKMSSTSFPSLTQKKGDF